MIYTDETGRTYSWTEATAVPPKRRLPRSWKYQSGCSCSRCVIRRRVDELVGRIAV